MGISKPAHALIPLRAICGNAVEISLEGPEEILLHLIQERIGGDEVSCLFDRSVDNPATKSVHSGDAGISGQLDIPESMVREPGLIDLIRAAFEDVCIFGFGFSQVFSVDISIGIEKLGEPHLDRGSCFAFNSELCPPAEVLSHIEDEDSWRRIGNFVGYDRIDDLDGGHHLREEKSFGTDGQIRFLPAAVIVTGLVPARSF